MEKHDNTRQPKTELIKGVTRTRLSCGHLLQEKVGHKKFCRVCFNNKRRAKRRALGFPYWVAEGRSISGYIAHNERVKRYFRQHPERGRDARHRSYAKQVKLYGGDPHQTWGARLKWLAAEKATRLPRLKEGARTKRTPCGT